MRLTYDREADAAYIYLVDKILPGAVKLTVPVETPKEYSGMIHLDFGEDGKLLGIEILNASTVLTLQPE
jgi:uncharacterized protein YuzE